MSGSLFSKHIFTEFDWLLNTILPLNLHWFAAACYHTYIHGHRVVVMNSTSTICSSHLKCQDFQLVICHQSCRPVGQLPCFQTLSIVCLILEEFHVIECHFKFHIHNENKAVFLCIGLLCLWLIASTICSYIIVQLHCVSLYCESALWALWGTWHWCFRCSGQAIMWFLVYSVKYNLYITEVIISDKCVQ